MRTRHVVDGAGSTRTGTATVEALRAHMIVQRRIGVPSFLGLPRRDAPVRVIVCARPGAVREAGSAVSVRSPDLLQREGAFYLLRD